MFDGMKKEVRQYRDILGKAVTLRPKEALAARRCDCGVFYVRMCTILTQLPGFPKAPSAFYITPDENAEGKRGQIVAVILPQASDFVRFVTAPEGTILFEPDLVKLLGADCVSPSDRIYCLNEKSCGAVLYTHHKGQIYYLLIKNQSGHIGFPKGHVEYGENEIDTIVREIREETGLIISPDVSFREEYDYMLCGVIRKKAVYCIAEFNYHSEITLGQDEIFGKWLLTYDEARNKLGFPNDRRILQKANKRILENANKSDRSV